MRRIMLLIAFTLPLSANAEGPIAESEKIPFYRCEQDGNVFYTSEASQFAAGACVVAATVVREWNGATILTACLDAPRPETAGMYVGPSLRARECTRQLCQTAEAQEAVRLFALSQEQSGASRKVGQVCAARAEADRAGR